MPAAVELVLGLMAACLALGAATQRNWKAAGRVRNSVRSWILAIGWTLLALSAFGFVLQFGWEVGIAWFLIWFGLTAVAATVWVGLGPRSAVWVGSILLTIAIALGAI